MPARSQLCLWNLSSHGAWRWNLQGSVHSCCSGHMLHSQPCLLVEGAWSFSGFAILLLLPPPYIHVEKKDNEHQECGCASFPFMPVCAWRCGVASPTPTAQRAIEWVWGTASSGSSTQLPTGHSHLSCPPFQKQRWPNLRSLPLEAGWVQRNSPACLDVMSRVKLG